MADGASDADLLVALSQDVVAFEAFYERYFERVAAFAATRCSSAEDVADVTGMLALLYAFPIVAALVTDPRWQHRLARYGPMEAGLSVQHTMRLDQLPIGPWPGLGVLATYAGVALLAGLTLFQRRDA